MKAKSNLSISVNLDNFRPPPKQLLMVFVIKTSFCFATSPKTNKRYTAKDISSGKPLPLKSSLSSSQNSKILVKIQKPVSVPHCIMNFIWKQNLIKQIISLIEQLFTIEWTSNAKRISTHILKKWIESAVWSAARVTSLNALTFPFNYRDSKVPCFPIFILNRKA